MTKKDPSSLHNHPILTPEQQQEQALLLEPFYERLIGMAFDDSSSAVERCRDLCAEFGFTVKQEASTHRNIYVYCSREGLPDSLRNPKSNPQRKRPSKRCDCRWRIVLFENEQNKWEFRKSLNPEAGKHNHELMRPEEIERSWPKEIIDTIYELARLRMATQDIRIRIREQFPDIHWNERRFYNRLSEERQKIKIRDSSERTHQLSELWSKICMTTAGNDDLFQFVRQELAMLFQSICSTVQIQPDELPTPFVLEDTDLVDTTKKSFKTDIASPKGYVPVEIPKQIYYIKIHNQRQVQESQLMKAQQKRMRPEDIQRMSEPPKKLARKGKAKQPSPLVLPNGSSMPTMHNTLSRILPPAYPRTPIPLTPPPRHQPIQQAPPPPPPPPPSSFVYTFNSNIRLDTDALTGYVHPSASFHHHHHHNQQHSYTMTGSSNTPGFTASDMSFTFDPQQHSPIGRSSVESSNSNNNTSEPTIHPALHSNPMSQNNSNNSNDNNNNNPQPMYSMPNTPMYDSPQKDTIATNMMSSPQTPYQQSMFINQPSSPNHPILPMYSQSSSENTSR